MTCAICETATRPNQKFCRSCGSRLQAAEPEVSAGMARAACPRCQHDNAPDHRFCRSCGAALSWSGKLARPSRAMGLPTDDDPTIVLDGMMEELAPDEPPVAAAVPAPPSATDQVLHSTHSEPVEGVGPPCEMCGAPAGGRRFCVDCDPSADREEPIVPPRPVAPPPVVPADRSAEPRGRRMRVARIAAGLGLVVAGAATAVALLATRDDAEPGRSAATRPAVRASPAPGGAGASTPDSASATGATRGPARGDPTTGSDEGGAAPARADTGPENAVRDHWAAIDRGDFSAAYDRFSSKYRTGHSFEEWSTGMRGFSPEVDVVAVKEVGTAGYRASVRVILATRDRGEKGDASRCHIFRGRVRLVREHGRWLYDPPGLREKHKGGIDPSSDARCNRLFP